MTEMQDKLDMLDLLITALKEHEKKLDDLINRLETKLEKKESSLWDSLE